jgi:hypothetical protein
MKARARLSIVAGVICGALAMAGVAWAAASTQITLNPGLDNPHGKIFSSSKSCLGNRTVIVFMQKGTTQKPATDKKMDTTKSQRVGDHGIWDMGNPGFPHHKKYYAEATAKTGCKAAFSKTHTFIP